MFSVLGETIDELVDSILVSNAICSDAFASVNINMPVYLLICTIGSLLAGCCSMLSTKSTGKGDQKRLEMYYYTTDNLNTQIIMIVYHLKRKGLISVSHRDKTIYTEI